MKKEQNAFTLVELLAVIVILAIVLIIAVPGVLSIINKTKDNALDRQLDMIKEASRLYVTSDNDVTWVGQDSKTTTVVLDTLKAKGYLDKKLVDPKTKKEITCAKTVITRTGSKYDYDVTLCDQVNGSPRLSSNMIPIVWNGSTWVKADYTNQDNNWYNYENQQWANMATVTESTREAYKKATIGSEVKMDDINTMFVWIPRFKYKLFNVDGTVSPVGNPNMAGDYLIDVQLEDTSTSKSTGTQNGQWLTHPAFTFGGQELEGFWMAKFETGYKDATTTAEAEVNMIDPSKIIVKPGVYSWRGIQTVNMYKNAQGVGESGNLYGFTRNEDPHLTKNMEWGAMTYLTYSKYGKAGNTNYTGVEKQVRSNNSTMYLTGCGADTQDAVVTSTCNVYTTVNGQAASTTGNISGVYDTAGGAWDAVFTVIKHQNGVDYTPGRTGIPEDLLTTLAKGQKYIDVYEYKDTWVDRSRGHLGDATKEMGPFGIDTSNDRSSWYQDYSRFVGQVTTMMYRGGSQANDPTGLGTTAFYLWDGHAIGNGTFRIMLV